MKKLSILFLLFAGLIVFSCHKKQPGFVNSIPDNAIVVVSMHPMQLHSKGQLNTLENLKSEIKEEFLKEIIEDPLSSGLMLDEYAYAYVTMNDAGPMVGVIAGMNNVGRFESLMNRIDGVTSDKIIEKGGFKMMVSPEKEGVIGWNDEQMIMLIQPEGGMDDESWELALSASFDLPREKSITSMVDFNDFTGKMKDLNAWISSDELRELLETLDSAKNMKINLPVTFYNNYAQLYCEFVNGAVKVTGETHFSEEVSKNIEEYLVMKSSLNKEMLALAPGGDLLLAMAASIDLEKMQKVMKDVSTSDSSGIGQKIEQAVGIPANELWQALTGDFVLAVNGIEGESMIPVELFIGLGVDNEALQDKLMGSVENMAQVEKEGDFFVINVQGIEIYSGIVEGIWVITNAKGYREAVKGGGLKSNLSDTKFNDFAFNSMGMYMNLNLSEYPPIVQQQLSNNPANKEWLEYITESFSYLGITSGNYNSSLILETNKPGENSLYTIMKMTELKTN